MSKQYKILALGSYEDAIYHPFQGIDNELKKIFYEHELVCSGKYNDLETLQDYHLVILYLDIWHSSLPKEKAQPLTDDQTIGLMDFVTNGGRLLVLHNGISVQSRPELEKLIGARFVTHPPMTTLIYHFQKETFTDGMQTYTLQEEPYQYEMENDGKDIFMTYSYERKEYPAGWRKTIGEGRLVYLAPGHSCCQFKSPSYRNVIYQCAKRMMQKEM